MEKCKRLNINIKRIGIGLGTLAIVFVLLWAAYLRFNHQSNDEIVMGINNIGIERALKFGDSLKTNPIIWVEGQNVGSMTSCQRNNLIQSKVDTIKEREVTATHEDQLLKTTLGNLGFALEEDKDHILGQIEDLYQELIQEQRVTRARVPFIGQYDLTYTYSEQLAEEWVQSIANQLHVAVVEPTLSQTGESFDVTPGKTGVSVTTEKLSQDLHQELRDLEKSNFNVDVEVETLSPQRSQSLLESVDTIVASASSKFPLSDVGRTQNVKLSTQRINGTLLMPGDEFSYAEKVEPVTFEGGYKSAAVFINGQLDEDVGGGICQTSSTLYWAQLRAGILPTQRRAHSLPVGYVPLGLDATYATDLIDYRFVNTLDYPVYIHAHINGNTLTVDLWSNSQALNGYTYDTRQEQIDNNSQNKTYSTFLRTYRDGSLVSESFLNNSTYRHP